MRIDLQHHLRAGDVPHRPKEIPHGKTAFLMVLYLLYKYALTETGARQPMAAAAVPPPPSSVRLRHPPGGRGGRGAAAGVGQPAQEAQPVEGETGLAQGGDRQQLRQL